jgi:hypothetical protein
LAVPDYLVLAQRAATTVAETLAVVEVTKGLVVVPRTFEHLQRLTSVLRWPQVAVAAAALAVAWAVQLEVSMERRASMAKVKEAGEQANLVAAMAVHLTEAPQVRVVHLARAAPADQAQPQVAVEVVAATSAEAVVAQTWMPVALTAVAVAVVHRGLTQQQLPLPHIHRGIALVMVLLSLAMRFRQPFLHLRRVQI